jgi:hypothetical protein
MQAFLICAVTAIILVGLGLAVCIASDRRERRRSLKQLRREMLAQPDLSDEQFAAAFPGVESRRVLEMRGLLAELLGIDPRKIHPEWRFCEGRDLRILEMPIFCAFAERYAPDTLRDHRPFEFPKGTVTTVRDLFLEARKLETEA